MPRYLVKATGKHSADYIVIRKGLKNVGDIIKRWQRKGYKLARAKNYAEAVTKVTGVELGRVLMIRKASSPAGGKG